MFPERKNKSDISWAPSATLANLQKRAAILKKIRQFFDDRNVMEVDTPLMAQSSVTDPYIESIQVYLSENEIRYLQTSPEYAMKRLLAAGSGSIFQICKAFRCDQVGPLHQPEFTLLEWYRIHFDHHQLMDEMNDFLQFILSVNVAERITYADLFQTYLNIDPHEISQAELIRQLKKNHIQLGSAIQDKDSCLQLLFKYLIEPNLGQNQTPTFIYDFPSSQAALARLSETSSWLASRFEVYVEGVELANGFHELADAELQRIRFENNRGARKTLGLVEMAIDEYLLAALRSGLPNCSGVALGLDRLYMLATNSTHIKDVLSFDYDRI